MDSEIHERLVKYCEESGQTKTVAVERALGMFIDEWDKKQEKLTASSD